MFTNKLCCLVVALLFCVAFISAYENTQENVDVETIVLSSDAFSEDYESTPTMQSTTVVSAFGPQNTGASTPQPGTAEQTKAATIGIAVAIILLSIASVLLLVIVLVVVAIKMHNKVRQKQFEEYRNVQETTSEGDIESIEKAHDP